MRRKPWTGVLLKPIRIEDAPARGLSLVLGTPPSADDVMAHLREQFEARWQAFDEFFALERQGDNYVGRCKALIDHVFGIKADDPRWCERLTWALATRHIPGFSLHAPKKKKHGAPVEWTSQRQAQLFADVEQLKRKTGLSAVEICKTILRKKPYAGRWHGFGPETLRKQYAAAKCNRKDLEFELVLCGGAHLMPTKTRIDSIDAAIELHALRT